MPELPDVEGFRRVASRMAGRQIDRADILDAGVLHDVDAPTLQRRISGRVLGSPRRHGKWLIAPLRAPGKRHRPDEPSLLFHFGMTGELIWENDAEPRHRHDRLALRTGQRELRYRDMRKLQGVWFAGNDGDVDATLSELGPDAADVTAEQLRRGLEGRNRRLKATLMDQKVVAGLGNLIVDEILWRARLHPDMRSRDLDTDAQQRLHTELQTVLRQSMPVGRIPTTEEWLTGRRDEKDPHCPRCGTPLRKSRAGGRATVWCPSCQAPP